MFFSFQFYRFPPITSERFVFCVLYSKWQFGSASLSHSTNCSLCRSIYQFEIYCFDVRLNTQVRLTTLICCDIAARLVLSSLQTDLNPDPSSLPFILQRLDRDGSVLKGPPGYQVSYSY